MCWLLASQSKDEKTKLGAVIVGPDGDIKSTVWNGFPRGIDDNIPERQQRPEKYYWFVHAEHNAILNAGRNGIPLKGSTLYCSAFPCANCAQAIIQSGIVKVVYDEILGGWSESNEKSLQMLKEANVVTINSSSKLIVPERFIDGKIMELK
jgi:dCMP deaminase